jgi:hypothetical protein
MTHQERAPRMAEVYEARRPGPRGFAKRVALKRILPQLAAALCAPRRSPSSLVFRRAPS